MSILVKNLNIPLHNNFFNFNYSNFLSYLKPLYEELSRTVKPNYDVNELRLIFPEFREDLEMFEVLSYDEDGTLYEILTTPNTKLYYPEPFVATPSFSHEDL